MSDTPRTDAVVNGDTENTLVAQLCRQLERELAESQAQYNILVSGSPKRLVEGNA